MHPDFKATEQLEAEIATLRRQLADWQAVQRVASTDALDYEAIFRASPGLLLVLSPDLTILSASDAYCRATLTRCDAIAGRFMFDVFPDANPDNPEASGVSNLRASLIRVLESKQPDEMPLQRYDLDRPDGGFEERYWRPLNTPVLGPDGEVRYIIHCVEDATPDMQLKASEARRQAEWNQAMQAQSLASERLLAKADELQAATDELQSRAAEQANQQLELHAANTQLLGQAIELRHRKELLSRIIAGAPVGIAYLNRDLHYEWVNLKQAEMLHMAFDDFAGKSLAQVFGAEAAARIRDLHRSVFEMGEQLTVSGYAFSYLVDGRMRQTHWDFTYQPVFEQGEVVGLLALTQEVSERVENERLQQERIQALEEADRLKDQFLGILSHELRTPINAITGFGSFLVEEGEGLSDAHRIYLKKMLAASDTLLALVNDLLDMSRIQAGKFTIAPASLALTGVIDDVMADLAPKAAARALTLRHVVGADLPAVWADEQRVSQVLSNLVGNAIKFTQPGGWVEVRARVTGGMLRCEVEDNGPGISAEFQATLFDAFTQVDMSNTRQTGGVGLGLSICEALVQAHGGRIGVGSDEGKGATFWFTLPLAGPGGQAPSPA